MRQYPSGWIGFCRLRGFLFRIGDGIAPQLLLGGKGFFFKEHLNY